MISEADIEKLLGLSRIEVVSSEKEKLRKDVESILAYVGEIQNAVVDERVKIEAGELRNVMREDGEPHEAGLYTGQLLKEAPGRDDDYIVVKKILP